MVHYYSDKVHGGLFNLVTGGSIAPKNYFQDKDLPVFYTILFNTGKDVMIQIDGIDFLFPAYAIIPIMFNQSFRLSSNTDVIMWQFNREFYCIVNHDKEVGCAGFLFYGSWGQIILDTDALTRKKLKLLIEVFKDEFEEKDDVQGNMLRMLLVRLIITVTRLARTKYVPENVSKDGKFDLLRQFNLLVESHYRSNHDVGFYAAALYKSPKTLSNTFAKFNAPTPLQIIHSRILLEAKRLLHFTDKTIKEISFDLGFEDAAHFTKFFRKQQGNSPSAFRKHS